METRSYRIASEAAMTAFGQAVAQTLGGRDVIGLIGPLGAGKSVFARGLIRCLITDHITGRVTGRDKKPIRAPNLSAGEATPALAAPDSPTPVPVPSPTFTLLETYDTAIGQLSHLDLYRLPLTDGQIAPGDAHQLGLDDAMAGGPVLIEWADRALDLLPPETILMAIAPPNATETHDDTERHITTAAPHAWFARPQTAALLPYQAP
ncbi:MAG: tRNA (adenosine(37)-N6)-threonylcarbamoyltransferase complex ATPase subunit type 1 TsaE [Pseudomonadota bacterium]